MQSDRSDVIIYRAGLPVDERPDLCEEDPMENHRPDPTNPQEPSSKSPAPGGFTPPIPPSRPIPPARPLPPRVPPSAIAAPVRPGPPVNYRPPSQVTSQPVYVDRRVLFGSLGGAVLLLAILAIWTNLSRTPAQINDSNLELRAGRDVRKNLSGADWATLSLPSTLSVDTLLKTGSDNRNILAMTDGGSIRLDRGTSIKLVSIRAQGEGQKVHLILYRGRVFISEGPESDVSVETKFVNVVPVGTRFSVSQIEKSDLTESTTVQVVEGSVRVTHLEDTSANLIVKANEQATAGALVLESPRPNKSDGWVSWNSGWTDLAKIPGAGAAASSTPATTSRMRPTAPAAPAAPAPSAPPEPTLAPGPPPVPVPQPAPPPMGPPPSAPFQPRPEPPLIQPQAPRAAPAPPMRPAPRPAAPRQAPAPPKPPPLIRPDRPLPPQVHLEDDTNSGTFTADPSRSINAPPSGSLPPSGGSGPQDSSSDGGSVLDAGSTGGGYPTPAPESDRRLPGY